MNLNLRQSEDLINQAMSVQGLIPGANLLIKKADEIIYSESFGSFFPESGKQAVDENYKVEANTIFDLGNLSPLIGLIPVFSNLKTRGLIDLGDQVIRYLQGFSVNGKASITLADLLFHISGLPAEKNYLEQILKSDNSKTLGLATTPGAKQFVINEIVRSKLKTLPRKEQDYSDLGMIVLGAIIEELSGKSLQKNAEEIVFSKLDLSTTSFINLNHLRTGLEVNKSYVAPSSLCSTRKKQIWCEVEDHTAWAMGGVAGHAGLFSSAADLSKVFDAYFDSYHSRSEFIDREFLSVIWDLDKEPGGLQYVGGWEVPHKNNGLIDAKLSSDAVGFNANTGSCVWLEPKKDLQVIFLANANCPNGINKKYGQFQIELIKSIFSEL